MRIEYKAYVVALMLSIFFIFSAAVAGHGMPKELAEEFTQFPGSSVMNAMSSAQLVQAILNCGTAEIDTVYGYYKKMAAQNGWQVQRDSKSAGIYNLTLRKNNHGAMIMVSSANGSTSVTLNMMRR